jgi:hypothetical protein
LAHLLIFGSEIASWARRLLRRARDVFFFGVGMPVSSVLR